MKDEKYYRPLPFTADDWYGFLTDASIFKESDIEFVTTLYHFPNGKATATDIAQQMGVMYPSLNLKEAAIVKRIMKRRHDVAYPKREDGTYRYWNTLFYGGDAEKKGMYYWQLRDELKEALTRYLQKEPAQIAQEISHTEAEVLYEGAKKSIIVNRYERNETARKQCLAHYGYTCTVCELRFEEMYGDIGENFIEVHHVTPLHTINERYVVNPIRDLRPVCSNCHSMLHRGNVLIEELRDVLIAKKKDDFCTK
ncbi:MAG: HNH endonuclease [Caryophanon sp.]|nr:HNH endonuclease [Caryophanon sp.]